jgi:NAD(P)-dependent dehydrogenase (short-subunit alcohol dehydrogenase family)
VTGASAGFGRAAAAILLSKGVDVVYAVRTPALGDEAAASAAAKAAAGGARAIVLRLDLADLATVAPFAEALERGTAATHRLAYLINNAGIGIITAGAPTTAQGLSKIVGANHFGHAALFNALLPRLRRDRTRVVAVSSMLHAQGAVAPEGAPLDGAPVSDGGLALQAYNDSKLLNVMWAREVQRRFSRDGITATSLHPGNGMYTNIYRDSTLMRVLQYTLIPLFVPLMWLSGNFQTAHDGGAAEVAAAESDEPGSYFHVRRRVDSSPASRDAGACERVWRETQRVLAAAADKYGLPRSLACADDSDGAA